MLGAVIDWSAVRFVAPAPEGKPTIADIQRSVSALHRVTRQELNGASKAWRIAHPRQLAMCLARELTDYSFPQIGRLFGNRHHTTVLFAYRKVLRTSQSDPQVAAALDDLRGAVRQQVRDRESAERSQ